MAETRWRERLGLIPWILLDILRHFFTENKLLKLVSLAIAFFMWYSISTKEQKNRTLENVPLTVVNHRGDTIVMNLPVKVVDVRVRGPVSVVDKLGVEDLRVQVDVSGREPGSYLLSPEPVNSPASVEVLEIDPPIIPVTVDALVTRQFPVSPRIDTSQLPPDSVVLDSSVTPPTVAVTGPKSKVDAIRQVATAPIRPQRIGTGLTFTARLMLPDQNLRARPAVVTVTLDLDRLAEKRLTGIQLRLPQRVRRARQTVNLTLKGPQSLLDRIKPGDIIVKLDVARLSRGDHQVSPLVELPAAFRQRVEVISVEPERIHVRIR